MAGCPLKPFLFQSHDILNTSLALSGNEVSGYQKTSTQKSSPVFTGPPQKRLDRRDQLRQAKQRGSIEDLG